MLAQISARKAQAFGTVPQTRSSSRLASTRQRAVTAVAAMKPTLYYLPLRGKFGWHMLLKFIFSLLLIFCGAVAM
jgi:hypothetical protein